MSKIVNLLDNKLDQWNSMEVEQGDQSEAPDGMKHYVTVKQGRKEFRIFAADDGSVRCPCKKETQKSEQDYCLHIRKAVFTYSKEEE